MLRADVVVLEAAGLLLRPPNHLSRLLAKALYSGLRTRALALHCPARLRVLRARLLHPPADRLLAGPLVSHVILTFRPDPTRHGRWIDATTCPRPRPLLLVAGSGVGRSRHGGCAWNPAHLEPTTLATTRVPAVR